MAAVAASSTLAGLSVLDLPANRLGDAGAEALATCGALSGLTALDIRQNRVGDRGRSALATSVALRGCYVYGLLDVDPEPA